MVNHYAVGIVRNHPDKLFVLDNRSNQLCNPQPERNARDCGYIRNDAAVVKLHTLWWGVFKIFTECEEKKLNSENDCKICNAVEIIVFFKLFVIKSAKLKTRQKKHWPEQQQQRTLWGRIPNAVLHTENSDCKIHGKNDILVAPVNLFEQFTEQYVKNINAEQRIYKPRTEVVGKTFAVNKRHNKKVVQIKFALSNRIADLSKCECDYSVNNVP